MVELEPVLDGVVPAVVEVVESSSDAPVAVEVVVPAGLSLAGVPAEYGVTPPSAVIVDVPPDVRSLSFDGAVTVVVEVVTVVGVAEDVGRDVAAILTAWVWGGGLAARGAPSSSGSTVAPAAEPARGEITCRVAGATTRRVRVVVDATRGW